MAIVSVVLCWCRVVNAGAVQQFDDVINPAVRHQKIEYFTASDCWSMQKVGQWAEPNRSKVADLLFSQTSGIGLSGWRFNLTGGVELTRIRSSWRTGDSFEVSQHAYDWTRCPGQRWFLAAAKSRGVGTFIAFCNSPPKRMTVNGLTSMDPDNNALTSNLKPGMEGQYADYLADILQHFRDNPDSAERIDFKWVSPINEPQWKWTGWQEGSRASNDDILRQYRAIASALRARQLTTRLLGPESGSIPDMYRGDSDATAKWHASYGDYINALSRDPDLAMAMDHTLASHSYWSDAPGQLVSDRQELRKAMDQHPQWRLAMTEYCVMEKGRDLGMSMALRAARVLYLDLTMANATSWAWWLAVSNGDYKDGLIYTDYKGPGSEENILPSKWFWVYGNFTRFVRPGMIRVDITNGKARFDANGIAGSAYMNPRTGDVVAVYLNSSDQSVPLHLSVSGQPAMRWKAFVTTDAPGDNLRPLHDAANSQDITLAPRSATTLVSVH